MGGPGGYRGSGVGARSGRQCLQQGGTVGGSRLGGQEQGTLLPAGGQTERQAKSEAGNHCGRSGRKRNAVGQADNPSNRTGKLAD